MITMTDKSAEKVREFLATQAAVADTAGLRVGVRGGGCAGFQYALAFDEQRDGDCVCEDKGIRLQGDRPSLPFAAPRARQVRPPRAPAQTCRGAEAPRRRRACPS